MGRVAVPLLVLLVAAFTALPAARAEPAIAGITGSAGGKEARVRFTLVGAFTPEMMEALKSGIEMSFRTDVRVERVHRNWFDATVGELRISRSVRYDALARVYRLQRGKGEELLPDVAAAVAGMTEYDVAVPLNDAARPGRRYRARVKTRLDKVGLSEPLRSIFFFSSLWDLETRWGQGDLASP